MIRRRWIKSIVYGNQHRSLKDWIHAGRIQFWNESWWHRKSIP